jgi:YesN/AraC family two-component response regulator
VLEARNGAEAVKVYDAEGAGVDLLVTDILTPHLSGVELIAMLRKRRKH